ncbi:MAG: type II secretion system F family protein [bacterium]
MNMLWWIIILVFATCFWLVYLGLGRVMGPRLTVDERLAYLAAAKRKTGQTTERWSSIPAVNQAMSRFRLARDLEDLLDHAEVPMRPFEFLLLVLVSGLALTALGQLFDRGSAVSALLGVSGGLIPIMWVRIRRRRRREAFNRQLPDALHAISSSLRAGYGFSQGMTVVARDLPAPISQEFARAQREMNLGLTIEDVLHQLSSRVHSIDFDLAVTGILINRQVGGNLAELLDGISATIRERVKLKNFIRVLTAEQKFSALIVLSVPPVVLVVLFAGLREYTNYLLFTGLGQALLVLSVLMQLVGTYFIRRIIAIDV